MQNLLNILLALTIVGTISVPILYTLLYTHGKLNDSNWCRVGDFIINKIYEYRFKKYINKRYYKRSTGEELHITGVYSQIDAYYDRSRRVYPRFYYSFIHRLDRVESMNVPSFIEALRKNRIEDRGPYVYGKAKSHMPGWF